MPKRSAGLLALRSTAHNRRDELVMDGERRHLLRGRPSG